MHFSDNFADEKGLESTKILKIVLAWVNETRIFHEKWDIGQLHRKHSSSPEKTRIWTPSLVFYNTDETIKTSVDEESRIMVKKEGESQINTIDNVDNVYMYNGSENPLIMERNYHTKW